MKKIILFLVPAAILGAFFYNLFFRSPAWPNKKPTDKKDNSLAGENTPQSISQDASLETIQDTPSKTPGFSSPLPRPKERVTKKPFGIYITPENSPVKPERFSGYHTGTDFEVFPDEINSDVTVRAVCDGKLLLKQNASGYGGVAVESCILEKEPLTVIYGHLKLESINFSKGDIIKAGETLGILGKGQSSETDGERKHLHLGFHKGSSLNIRGYVNTKDQLSGWIDPCRYVCQ